VASGFQRFLSATRIQDAIGRFADEAEAAGESSVFDTHPPLAERLAELAAMHQATAEDRRPDPPAATLVGSVEALSHQLLAFVNGEEKIARLPPVDWADVPQRVHMVQWQAMVNTLAAPLAALTIDALPAGTQAFVAVGRRLVVPGESIVDRDAAAARAVAVLTGAMVVALVAHGWVLAAAPGDHFTLSRGPHEVVPAIVIHDLLTGTLSGETWQTRCVALGVTGVHLGPSTMTV
jgi:hypothetical protein